MSAPITPPHPWSFWARLLLVPLIWGMAFVWAKIGADGMEAAAAAFVRYSCATLALLFACWRLEGRLPALPRRQWRGAVLLAVTGVSLYNMMIFGALQSLEASRASLIIALSPALIAVGSILFLREALGWSRFLGLFLALAGAWVVILRGDLNHPSLGFGKGEMMMLGAVACWVTYSLYSRRFQVRNQELGLSLLAMTTWTSLIGTLMLLPLAIPALMHLKPAASHPAPWAALALMGLLGTAVAFIWYAEGIQKIGAARTAVFTNLVPVFAVLSSIIFLNEEMHWSLLAGGGLILGGVLLVQRR